MHADNTFNRNIYSLPLLHKHGLLTLHSNCELARKCSLEYVMFMSCNDVLLMTFFTLCIITLLMLVVVLKVV